MKDELTEIDLPYGLELRDYQKAIWDYMLQPIPGLRALTIWPRRNGKDLIALNILIAKAIQRPGLYLYIGPLHTQIRQIVWLGGTNDGKRFLDYIPPQLVKAKRNSVMEIDLINGAMIKLVGSDQYDSLMGLNAMGVIFTEYSLQKPEAWDYIRPMLSENGGWGLFNGTTRGLNHMYAMARMAEKNPKWFYQYFTRDDTSHPTLEAIQDDREAGMRESLIQQEFYNDWNASSEEVYIPLDIVVPSSDGSLNPLQPEEYNFAPKVMGVDVAYAAKGDKATICRRQGRMCHELDVYQGLDNMAFASQVAKRIKEFKPTAVFVDAGRGEGVISRLWQMGFQDEVVPVHFGGKTYDELYSNKKAEMWGRLRDWFLAGNKPQIPNNEQLIKEITTPFGDLDEKNKIAIETKRAMKTRGESSPDLADSLILTFAEEIVGEEQPTEDMKRMGISAELLSQLTPNKDFAEMDYDVLNHLNM